MRRFPPLTALRSVTDDAVAHGCSKAVTVQCEVFSGDAVQRRQFNSLLVAGGGLAAAACAYAPQDAADCAAIPSANGLTEQDVRDYIAAFNRGDFPGFSKYYAEDVIFEGRGRSFRSRREVVDFYTEVKKRLRETITIHEIIVGEQDIAAEIETELYAFEDWPELVTGAIKKGQTIRSQNFIWYQVKDGKFVHIRSARYRKLA
jgi:DNA-binding protein